MTVPLGEFDTDKPVAMLHSLQPLFFGVLVGAMLAVWHTVVLHHAAHRVGVLLREGEQHLPRLDNHPVEEGLRTFAARLRRFVFDFDRQAEGTATQIQSRMDSLSGSLEQLNRSIIATAANWDHAGSRLMQAFARFEDVLPRAAASVTGGLEKVGGQVTAAGQGLAEQLKASQKTVGQANTHLASSIQELNLTLGHVQGAAKQLATFAQGMEERDAARQAAAKDSLSEISKLGETLRLRLVSGLDQAVSQLAEATGQCLAASQDVASASSRLPAGSRQEGSWLPKPAATRDEVIHAPANSDQFAHDDRPAPRRRRGWFRRVFSFLF